MISERILPMLLHENAASSNTTYEHLPPRMVGWFDARENSSPLPPPFGKKRRAEEWLMERANPHPDTQPLATTASTFTEAMI